MRGRDEPMTLDQLKRHMDRRFDRLQRTKANKTDLRRFATKDDLRAFATKDDLRAFATKDDLRAFATKDDLARLERKVDGHYAEVTRQLQSLNDKIDSVLVMMKSNSRDEWKVLHEHEGRIQDLEGRVGI